MNECLQEMSKMQEIRLQNSVNEVKSELCGLMNSLKEEVKGSQLNASL